MFAATRLISPMQSIEWLSTISVKPKINSEPIESRQSDKGSETALSCQFQGKEVDVYWQRNGQQYHSGEASEGNRIFAELENDSNLVLNLKSLELSDGGEYLCIASNPAGKAELTIQLEITR